ncbi:DUF4291 family protein [Actinomadura gamaensis]|uniref:DUF4291 family protein n=1 Tax=Actinomadura gamaensis TaxID=1763541 RepID=A0ABV9TYF4_9ACTN
MRTRETRAAYDHDSLTAYQASSPPTAAPPQNHGHFLPRFSRTNTTRIKPSFP